MTWIKVLVLLIIGRVGIPMFLNGNTYSYWIGIVCIILLVFLIIKLIKDEVN